MLETFSINYYPVVPDRGDHRDFLYERNNSDLRERVDLREWSSKVRNQTSLRSCAAEAVIGAYEIMLKKQYPEHYVDLSPLFVYHNAISLEMARPIMDVGVYIRDAILAVKKYGVCAESVWPYSPGNFSITPTEESYKDAKNRLIKKYLKINSLEKILGALNSEIPVVSSFKTYSNFSKMGWDFSSDLGLPNPGDIHMGGHAVVLVGYDQINKKIIAKNSFGPAWADRGYFYITFDYVEKYFMDSWIFEIELQNIKNSEIVEVEIID